MTVVFNFVLPILAGVFFVVALFFLGRAIGARTKVNNQPYNVGRQEARQQVSVNVVRAFFAFIIGLIIIGVVGIGPRVAAIIPTENATPLPIVTPTTPSSTAVPTFTVVPPTAEPSSTSPVETSTAAPLPTSTSTPEPLTAVVSSENGVWLRSAPGVETDQLEWLLFNTVVFVLEGRETVDEFEWQQVQTADGLAGWVAVEFITVNEP